jgi:glycerol-3-phosphate dehydrogenase
MGEDAVNNALFISSPPGRGRGGLKQSKHICLTVNLKIGDPEKRHAMIDVIIAEDPNTAKLLHENYPYTIADVIFAIRHELAETVEDILARRTRILFLNARVAIELAELIGSLLAKELGKDENWQEKQIASFCELAKQYIPSLEG